MFARRNRGEACKAWEARLEDFLDGRLDSGEAAEVEAHARSCARCTDAVEQARLAGGLLAVVRAQRAASPGAFFVPRVMNAVRNERRERDLWMPVERAAWRVCFIAATAAFVLALLLLRIPAAGPAVAAQDQSQMQVLVNMPAAQPVLQDDALLLVAGDENGR